MSLVATIVIGFIVGLIARLLHPGRDGLGIIMTTLLGIGGALLAGYGGQLLGLYRPGQPAGFIGSIVGAIVILLIVTRLRR
jgi:uncharacterized membrane protein YeaQ/YmgE (transglycosylase-associated protein family)